MERVGQKEIFNTVFTLALVVAAGAWLADYFSDPKYDGPLYSYAGFWFYFVSPILLIIIYFRMDYLSKKRKARGNKDYKNFIEAFKKHAKTVVVNFDDCEINHHEYEKEIILKKDTRQQERKIVRFSECKITYVDSNGDSSIVYSTPILYMELINLRYKLHHQKETIIYIDELGDQQYVDENGKTFYADEKGNPFYYFDVSFLGESVLQRPS